MNEVLAKLGLELQKWPTYNNELMIKPKQEEKELGENQKIKENNIIKILGLTGNRSDDTFHFNTRTFERVQNSI